MRKSVDIGIYDVEDPTIRESIVPTLGNSQITEPNILYPIYNVSDNPYPNNSTNTGNSSSGYIPIEVLTPVDTTNTSTGSTTGTSNSGTTSGNSSSGTTPNNTSEPSATTDDTKTYVSGGTTPDSQIVVKKPTTKYFIYGILGIVGAYVIYKTFFNKKSE